MSKANELARELRGTTEWLHHLDGFRKVARVMDEAADELERLANPWRPISEAPKDRTLVDLRTTGGDRLPRYSWSESDGAWIDPFDPSNNHWRPEEVTHFMPLPDPPTTNT